jgi:hypothetical protein
MEQEFKEGDVVLAINSYGGGVPFVGKVGIVISTIESNNIYPKCVTLVEFEEYTSFYVEAVALTELIKALL